MKSQSNPCQFLALLLISVLSTNVGLSERVSADANNGDLASAGLVVHWESNIGGAPLANGAQSFVLWSHTTEKREYVTVRNGNRIIERIRGEEIDQTVLDNAIVSGEKLLKTPRLGLAGAAKKAEKLVATYKVLGRKLDVEPFSQPLVYAVSLTNNGIVEAMDAETGAMIWRTEAGISSLPMFGPGVSDDYVAVTNGNTFYVYELATGNIVTTRKLASTPTACPIVLKDKAIVPSVDGRLVAYDINEAVIPPGVLRTGTENRLGLTISSSHQFFCWPTGNRLVLARMDKLPLLWNSISVNEPIHSIPVATQNGFLVCTAAGTVFLCSTGRDDALLWKSRLAVQVSQSPLVNKDLGFILSDDGFMFALNLADGVDAWGGFQPGNIRNLIAVGKTHIYAKDSRNALVAFDLATGAESGRTNFLLPDVIPNAINDRLLFVTKKGQVTCLRETEATSPTFATVFSGEAAAPVKLTKPEATPTKAIEEDSNVFEGAGAPASEADDPFKP